MKVWKISIVVMYVALSACMPKSTTTFITPAGGQTYVGMYGSPPPVQAHTELPEKITISYLKNPGSLKVYLNSAPIGQHFTFGNTEATADFVDVAEFLRQGKNVLMIDPQNFGPSTTFIFDNTGPKVIIDSVICSDGNCRLVDGGMVTVNVSVQDPSNTTDLTLFANDYAWEGAVDNSQYTPFKTGGVIEGVAYPMSSIGANKFTATIPESKLYTFVANDENGYSATTDYLSEGQKINSVFKMRIGKTLLDSMIPVIEPFIDNMYMYSKQAMDDYGKAYPADTTAQASAELDSLNKWWTSGAIFYGRTDMGAATANMSDCGYVDTDAALVNTDFKCSSVKTDQMNSSKKYCLTSNVAPNSALRSDAKKGRCSRIIIWQLKLDDMANMSFTLDDAANGRVRLDMDLLDSNDAGNTALYTNLGIRHIKCDHRFPVVSYCSSKLFGVCIWNETGVPVVNNVTAWVPSNTMSHDPKYYCHDDGDANVLGLVSLGNLQVTATSGNPKGYIDARVLDGTLYLSLSSSTLSLNLTGLTIGSAFDAFISFLSGMLDDLFVDIVSSVLKQNMTDFKVGFDINTDTGSTLRMQSQAYQVFTSADNNAATPVEWYMYYSGFLSPVVPHPDVMPLLGSYFVRDEMNMPADNTVSAIDNFSIGINANIINQGLASIYRSGLMHFTVANFNKDGGPKVYFGPDATVNETGFVNGDLRTVLMPNSPATFAMADGVTGVQATLEYQRAAMDVQIYQSGQWVTMFHAKVDIKAGVLMSVVNNKFHMTIQGTPEITVQELLDMNVKVSLLGNTFNIYASKVLLETLINQLIGFAIPQVADSFMVVDIPDIPGPLNTKVITSTEGIEANNGAHLGFSMGLNLQQ